MPTYLSILHLESCTFHHSSQALSRLPPQCTLTQTRWRVAASVIHGLLTVYAADSPVRLGVGSLSLGGSARGHILGATHISFSQAGIFDAVLLNLMHFPLPLRRVYSVSCGPRPLGLGALSCFLNHHSTPSVKVAKSFSLRHDIL